MRRLACAALAAATATAAPRAGATVTSTASSVTYTGNASTTVFAVPFKVLQAADLVVTVAAVTKVLATDYTVVVTSTGATVTFLSAPANAAAVVISRSLAFTQPTSLRSQGTYSPASVETAFDRLLMQIQQLNNTAGNALAAYAGGGTFAFLGISQIWTSPSSPGFSITGGASLVVGTPGGTGLSATGGVGFTDNVTKSAGGPGAAFTGGAGPATTAIVGGTGGDGFTALGGAAGNASGANNGGVGGRGAWIRGNTGGNSGSATGGIGGLGARITGGDSGFGGAAVGGDGLQVLAGNGSGGGKAGFGITSYGDPSFSSQGISSPTRGAIALDTRSPSAAQVGELWWDGTSFQFRAAQSNNLGFSACTGCTPQGDLVFTRQDATVYLVTGNPMLDASTTAGQSMNNTTTTIVVFGTANRDTDSGLNTGTGRYTVPAGKAGDYTVSAAVQWNGNAGAYPSICIYKNAAVYRCINAPSATGATASESISAVLYLAAADVIDIRVTQASGGSIALSTSAVFNYFTLKRIP